MKSSRIEKLAQHITVSEEELKLQLLSLLPGALSRDSLLFVNPEFNPLALRPHMLVPSSEELLTKSKECVQLRERLGIPEERSPGNLYISACKENASDSEHRRGPRRLAKWLLEELHNVT